MSNSLIVFASRHGTAEKSARLLFRLMNGKVDLCNLEEREFLPDLSTYDTVVVGGSVYSGVIQDSISNFCIEKRDELLHKRLGFFINCMYSGEKAQKQLQAAYPFELTSKALICDYFGGEIDKLKLNFWERVVAAQMIEKEDLVVALSKEKITDFADRMNAL